MLSFSSPTSFSSCLSLSLSCFSPFLLSCSGACSRSCSLFLKWVFFVVFLFFLFLSPFPSKRFSCTFLRSSDLLLFFSSAFHLFSHSINTPSLYSSSFSSSYSIFLFSRSSPPTSLPPSTLPISIILPHFPPLPLFSFSFPKTFLHPLPQVVGVDQGSWLRERQRWPACENRGPSGARCCRYACIGVPRVDPSSGYHREHI